LEKQKKTFLEIKIFIRAENIKYQFLKIIIRNKMRIEFCSFTELEIKIKTKIGKLAEVFFRKKFFVFLFQLFTWPRMCESSIRISCRTNVFSEDVVRKIVNVEAGTRPAIARRRPVVPPQEAGSLFRGRFFRSGKKLYFVMVKVFFELLKF
jgi:hypothetical protein